MTALRIHVRGATGGVGTTCLAAALAARAAARGLRTVVTERARGGLDVVTAVDVWPGVRLDDLGELDGTPDGARLLASLPRVPGDGAAVLAHAADRTGPGLDPDVVERVEDALAGVCDVLVVDAGRTCPPGGADVVVAGPSPHQLLLARAHPGALLALAGSVADVDEVAAHLGLAPGVALPRDPAVDRDLARGACPGASGRGRLGRAADTLLDLLLPAVGPADVHADVRGDVRAGASPEAAR